MKSNRLLVLSILILAVMSLRLPVPARAAEGHFARTLQVSGAVDLEVQTGSGTIDVRTGDSSTVRITGTIRSSGGWFDSGSTESKVRYLEANPPIEQHGNFIKIGHLEDRELQRNIAISYESVTPAETRLRSSSGSGEQTIEGLRGPVEASSGSGHLKLTNIGDMVRASTGSGRISLEGVKGNVHASTGSGEITATDVAGGLHASTGSGSVTLRQTAPGDVEVSTGSGTLQLEGVHGAVRQHRQRQHRGGGRRPRLLAALDCLRQRHRAPPQPAGLHAPRSHGLRQRSYRPRNDRSGHIGQT